MQPQLARLYLMRSLATTRKRQKEIAEKTAAGECIRDGCGEPQRSRGLCSHHRALFYSALSAQPDDAARLALEEDLVTSGEILPAGEVVRLRKAARNPYLRVS